MTRSRQSAHGGPGRRGGGGIYRQAVRRR